MYYYPQFNGYASRTPKLYTTTIPVILFLLNIRIQIPGEVKIPIESKIQICAMTEMISSSSVRLYLSYLHTNY